MKHMETSCELRQHQVTTAQQHYTNEKDELRKYDRHDEISEGKKRVSVPTGTLSFTHRVNPNDSVDAYNNHNNGTIRESYLHDIFHHIVE